MGVVKGVVSNFLFLIFLDPAWHPVYTSMMLYTPSGLDPGILKRGDSKMMILVIKK